MYAKKNFFVEGLSVYDCTNEDDLVVLMKEGMKNRRIESHDMNKDSSRSHSILTIYIVKDSQGKWVLGRVSFVDLAGSEWLKESNS